MSDSSYILLVLSITEIVFGSISAVGNLCRILIVYTAGGRQLDTMSLLSQQPNTQYAACLLSTVVDLMGFGILGVLVTGTKIGVPIFDLVLGLLLLIIGSYGVSVARKIRKGRTNSKSLPILDLLNILLCVIYSVYLLSMLLVATLITSYVTHSMAVSALEIMGISPPVDYPENMTFHIEEPDTILPVSESAQFAVIVVVILAEMVVTAFAAKMSRNIAAGRGSGAGAPGAATYPTRSSVYAHQPLLMSSEKV